MAFLKLPFTPDSLVSLFGVSSHRQPCSLSVPSHGNRCDKPGSEAPYHTQHPSLLSKILPGSWAELRPNWHLGRETSISQPQEMTGYGSRPVRLCGLVKEWLPTLHASMLHDELKGWEWPPAFQGHSMPHEVTSILCTILYITREI